MLRKGLAVAVILLFIGVAFTSSINANVSKSSVEPITDVDVIEENATPIQLVFQLISKLRNHKDIQDVETEDDVLQIIEDDEELNSIFEQLSQSNDEEDCGCEEETTELDFPFFICIFVSLLFVVGMAAWWMGRVTWIGELAGTLNGIFNCPFI